ncbi:MAG: type II toxin-antitoxin system prevent-host-death family antitoxin [Acidobacteria bacterium]|nr:type II toxin-antitoxin system prevent-host-death family antitoxin [Acidobacteriota bacterium]
MLTVNVHEAKTHLSRLIRRALDGEEVVIAKGNRPLIRLEVLPGAREARELGSEPGLIVRMDDDFDAPLEDFAEYA